MQRFCAFERLDNYSMYDAEMDQKTDNVREEVGLRDAPDLESAIVHLFVSCRKECSNQSSVPPTAAVVVVEKKICCLPYLDIERRWTS